MITLLFTRTNTLGSKIVRLLTKSEWSHVDVIVDGTYAVGALPNGVKLRTINSVVFDSSAYKIVRLDGNGILASKFIMEQMNKPYDWLGLIGLEIGNRKWQEDDKWFCSELAATALDKAGITLPFRDAYRVTPGMLYNYLNK